MCSVSLQHFCNRVVEAGQMSADDVTMLMREILPDGIGCRDEADMLFALDRAADCHASFVDYLTAATVDFAVWGERPTGFVTRETAEWLAVSLRGRSGPTPTAARIAIAIVREAQASDETLIAFALEANGRPRPSTAQVVRRPVPLAA